MQAFGGAVKELDGKGKEDVRAVFRQGTFQRIKKIKKFHRFHQLLGCCLMNFGKPRKDSFISGLLMSAPAAILSILLVFSSPYFHATLITCSLRYFIKTLSICPPSRATSVRRGPE